MRNIPKLSVYKWFLSALLAWGAVRICLFMLFNKQNVAFPAQAFLLYDILYDM